MEDDKKIKLTKEQYEYFKKYPKHWAAIKEDLRKEQQEQEFAKTKRGWRPTKIPKFKWKHKSILNKARKKRDQIVVFLLSQKQEVRLVTTKIYGGNFLVIDFKVYRYNPSRVHTMGKWKVVIAREGDRELYSHEGYERLLEEDRNSDNPGKRVNIDDPVLIKAVHMARLGEKGKIKGGKMLWIVGIIAVLVIAAFFIFGGSDPAPAAQVVGGAVASATPLG